MSYLQVVGEQHHQVEGHMAAFTSRVVELRAKHNLLLPGSVEVCETPRQTQVHMPCQGADHMRSAQPNSQQLVMSGETESVCCLVHACGAG
jgi:hypothetical protein